MKKLVSILFISTILLSSSGLFAQGKVKLGHLDFATLYGSLPGLDSVKTIFEAYNKSIQDQNAVMQSELESKFQEYQASVSTMSDIIRATKEAEINDLQSRMEAFQQKASADLQNKEAELTAPLIEEAKKAVEEVAKEKGYTYIFNSTEGLLLYSDPSDDIIDLVKTKLGIE